MIKSVSYKKFEKRKHESVIFHQIADMERNVIFKLGDASWIGKSKGHCHCLEWAENCDNVDELALKYKNSPDVQEKSVLLRTERKINKHVRNATLCVVGLGFYEFYMNGKKIGDRTLTPYITDFRKKIIFNEFNVTENIKIGNNSFCFELGSGWFCPDKRFWDWRYYWFGNPRAMMALKLECFDGTVDYIVTDENWKIRDGAITFNSIFDGEKVDSRQMPVGWLESEFDDSSWHTAVRVESPGGKLVPDIYPPMKVVRVIEPVGMKKISDTLTVYDFGENIPGFMQVFCSGKSGDKIILNHAERLNENGTLNYLSNNKAVCEDEYILRGDELEVYEPKFTWHGYQFSSISVSNPSMKIVSVKSKVVRSDVETTGRFSCDNIIINELHEKFVRTQLNCLLGIPVDCHQRDERLGWLGDAHVSAQMAIYNFRMDRFYKNWLYDMRLAQNTKSGDMPYIVPRPSKEPGTIDWSIAILLIPLSCYEFYGDKSFFDENFDSTARYFAFLLSTADNFILPRCKYGDWASPFPGSQRGDPECVATLYFLHFAKILAYMANILDKKSDEKYFTGLKEKISSAFIKKYYNSAEKFVVPDSQCSNSMALLLGVIPKADESAVLKRIVTSVESQDNHLTTGILGTKYLIDVLLKFGREDIIYKLLMQDTYPSWRNMLDGRSTLPEHWNGNGSGCHCMFGSVDTMFYRMLAGITIDYTGEHELIFNPFVPADINSVKASIRINCGTVSSSWQKHEDGITFYLQVPDKTNAKFIVNPRLKAHTVTLNGICMNDREFALSTGEHVVIVS